MFDPKKILLSTNVNKAIVEENERIRAELFEKGPAFDLTSIKPRLIRAKEQAEAAEAAEAEAAT